MVNVYEVTKENDICYFKGITKAWGYKLQIRLKLVKLQSRIPASESNPTQKVREVLQSRECTFSLRPVAPVEIEKIIAELKNTKSTGMDYVNTWVIKLIAKEMLPAITHIVNLSISKQQFPQSWKMAKVVPLLKKGDPLQPKNYRPVSLLPIFSKILEKAVFTQLVGYLESNKLLNPNLTTMGVGKAIILPQLCCKCTISGCTK